jgi:hypothetical protein
MSVHDEGESTRYRPLFFARVSSDGMDPFNIKMVHMHLILLARSVHHVRGPTIQHFFGLSFCSVVRVLQCRTLFHVSAMSYFPIFLFFFHPQADSRQTSADSPLLTHFGRAGLMNFLTWSLAHLHHSICLPVLHAPPLCPMF